MTKDEWLNVQKTLSSPFGCVHLLVDGYKLTLSVERVKPLAYEILPYVNGEMEVKWLLDETEEAKRFYRPCKKALYSPAKKKSLSKGLSKAMLKSVFPDIDKTFTYYLPFWPSFLSLKRHLIANNKSIELVKNTVPL